MIFFRFPRPGPAPRLPTRRQPHHPARHRRGGAGDGRTDVRGDGEEMRPGGYLSASGVSTTRCSSLCPPSFAPGNSGITRRSPAGSAATALWPRSSVSRPGLGRLYDSREQQGRGCEGEVGILARVTVIVKCTRSGRTFGAGQPCRGVDGKRGRAAEDGARHGETVGQQPFAEFKAGFMASFDVSVRSRRSERGCGRRRRGGHPVRAWAGRRSACRAARRLRRVQCRPAHADVEVDQRRHRGPRLATARARARVASKSSTRRRKVVVG